MTPVQSPPAPPHPQLQPQQQQILGGLTARLAQFLKDPPDLSVYLRAHAECVTTAFHPAGFSYEMLNGAAFQRVLHGNLETLNLKGSPEQENAFERARAQAVEQRRPVLLAPHSKVVGGIRAPTPADSPAPEETPLFNLTPFEQVFVPIPSGDAIVGVLHVWFQPTNNAASQLRVGILRQLCGEIDQYLRARRSRDALQEVARLTTYSKLLETLTGDIDLDSVGVKLVNYARDTIACERVCLFTASNYGAAPTVVSASTEELKYHFRLQACSGLKKPHPKSEQAVVLQNVARKLTQMSLTKAAAKQAAAADSTAANGSASSSPAVPVERPISAAPPAAKEPAPPSLQLTLIMRDPSKSATRPAEVNEYFEVMPMNWATVIPLFDREYQVCGILLFEGVKVEEKLGNSFKPMIDLAASAGKALGTTLYCTQPAPIRAARRLVAWHHDYVNTPARRRWLRVGLPIFAVIALLALPIPYSVKGNASVLPVKQSTLPALVGTRLLAVDVREGQTVVKGQILARFDTTDLRLQLSQAEQDYERSQVESDAALNAGNEPQMQISRLNAQKAAAAAEKLRLDLERAVLRAPFDGLVLGAQTLSTRVGEVLHLGEPALQVVDPKEWQVKASLREHDLIFLDRRIKRLGHVPATLRLAANPARKYELDLVSHAQLAYGLDTTTGEYQFTAMLPLNASLTDDQFFKAGFTGRVSFEAGVRPVAYVLFNDFIEFLIVRFF